ncbi:LysR family transcriptional regulator [Acetobacterium sp.]
MDIRHLKIMIAVAEAGSMSGAAKKLYITQPAVSQVI